MIRAVIIDDEPLAGSIIQNFLQDHKDISIAGIGYDGFEGFKLINEHTPDLLFLDIQMPKINGFEMLELLDKPGPVIFTTAFDEYAIQAFEKSAIDYLLKPFTKSRFDKAIEKFRQQFNQKAMLENLQPLLESASALPGQSNRIVVKYNSNIVIIPHYEIKYIEAADDYVKIHTGESSYLKNRTMSFFEKVLDPQVFVRVHRSYIINITKITRIDPFEKDQFRIQLTSGEVIPVSKTGYPKLKKVLGI